MNTNRVIDLFIGCALLMQICAVRTGEPVSSTIPSNAAGLKKALCNAAKNGEVSGVCTLLKAGVNVNAVRDPYTKLTALHEAVKEGHAKIVQILLEAGARVDAIDANTRTPLHWATKHGHIKVVRLLIQAGAHVDAVDGCKCSPLHRAAQNGHEEVVKILVKANANINTTGSYRSTPLSMAAKHGHIKVVQLLIQAGAHVDAVDGSGSTSLRTAARLGYANVVQALLEAGADVAAVSQNGNPALYDVEETIFRLLFDKARKLILPKQCGNMQINSRWFACPPSESRSLTAANGKKHYPIIFLINQKRTGGIILGKKRNYALKVEVKFDDTLFRNLCVQVALNNKLMIVSKGLAYGLIALAHERDDYTVIKRAINQQWEIYSVPETQFSIWMPRDYADHYREILKLSNFEKLSTNTKDAILRYCPSAVALDNDPQIQDLKRKYHEQDLAKIFDLDQISDKANAICDVWIGGHGLSGINAAGLPIRQDNPEEERITSLLSFLNSRVNTGAVFIKTCSAGGQNTRLMRMPKDSTLADYNYALIVASVSDKATRSTIKRMVRLTNAFFEFALEFSEQGHSILENFAKALVPQLRLPSGKDLRGYAAFPQVWLPGGMEYQVRNATSDVYTIGRVLASVAAEQKRSIELKDRQTVLWYPKVVDASVEVVPAKINSDKWRPPRQRFGKALCMIEEYIGDGLPQSEMDHIYAKYPAFSSLLHAHDKDTVRLLMEQAKKHLYPELVLMGGTAHRRLWLKKVVVNNGGNPFMGILRFLRDSFGDVGSGTDQKDILIESLEGTNDLPFHMETGRGNAEKISPLYKKLRASTGQTITLKAVMIRINAPEHPKRLAFYVPLDDGQWYLYTIPLRRTESAPSAWQFKHATAPSIEAFKQALDAYVVPVGRIAAKFDGNLPNH